MGNLSGDRLLCLVTNMWRGAGSFSVSWWSPTLQSFFGSCVKCCEESLKPLSLLPPSLPVCNLHPFCPFMFLYVPLASAESLWLHMRCFSVAGGAHAPASSSFCKLGLNFISRVSSRVSLLHFRLSWPAASSVCFVKCLGNMETVQLCYRLSVSDLRCLHPSTDRLQQDTSF